MSLDQSQVQGIAHLARLAIREDAIEGYTRDLGNILELVDQLQQADTGDLEPMSNPHDAVQLLRKDEVTEVNRREQLLAVAPAVEQGLFLVPRVVE
ncbi:Asp-tRNA(Asn)/Glu-tRNA(Gln) amidotransferase subunit GatC [Pelagibaculum spongiae]|uniref:Aspartyl/glutamyl-tRNA(Asn/Gln) amidotransferase subunit C n=1 Tax=Pelagibaculum spongiae TaxID=2080658 RepID=A0A2V1H422_9GAMM|nr:Asp-tRNA(Asn)/Glu-tRNA(Gln) amidotransferase subunit GatC [Pelagibaculum spongiae]PVZ71937.1 Asp-tRNA(Asn)/Glu-tRNA(Gln) amidotransferase GatCAB subunit C [Pelagibaculum spongiae]